MALKVNDAVFLDTAYFIALIDKKDEFHSQATKIWEGLIEQNKKLITSNFILDETFTLIRVKCGLKAVTEFRNRLAAGLNRMKIIRVLLRDETKAWDWFFEERSSLSFTDCVSFAVMHRLELKRVATFDRHFSKAGFEIV